MKSVYSAVRTGPLNEAVCATSLKFSIVLVIVGPGKLLSGGYRFALFYVYALLLVIFGLHVYFVFGIVAAKFYSCFVFQLFVLYVSLCVDLSFFF
jgi:hypothetical protein